MAAPKVSLKKVNHQFSIDLVEKVSFQVKKNQLIAENEVIARIKNIEEKVVNLASILGVKGDKVYKYLVQELGSQVKKGDLLARKKRFFGFRKVYSPLSGVLDSLNEDGRLEIVSSNEEEIKTPFSGRVVNVNDQQLILEFPALELKGENGLGNRSIGILALVENQSSPLDLSQIKDDLFDKILIIPGNLKQACWFKALSLGVAGIVCGYLEDDQLKETISRLTGFFSQERNRQPPLIILGKREIEKEIIDQIKKHQGKKALIEGKSARLVISLT